MMHRLVHYTARDDMTSIKLTALPDGPYRLDGQITIFDPEGQPIPPIAAGAPVFLCRCGRSADKPFCDGSHARAGWNVAA
jgi:CDGSH-type Zn-finger protein